MDVLLTVTATQLNRYWYGPVRPHSAPPVTPMRPVLLRLFAAVVGIAAAAMLLSLAG